MKSISLDSDVRITNRLSRALYLRGWADGVLAERTGLPRGRINRIKNGRLEPRTTDALLIAAALGVCVETIFSVEAGSRVKNMGRPTEPRRSGA